MKRTVVAAPLRNPAFQRLWLGLSISYLGDQFTIIASSASTSPASSPGAILGRLLDRYQPRLVVSFG